MSLRDKEKRLDLSFVHPTENEIEPCKEINGEKIISLQGPELKKYFWHFTPLCNKPECL